MHAPASTQVKIKEYNNEEKTPEIRKEKNELRKHIWGKTHTPTRDEENTEIVVIVLRKIIYYKHFYYYYQYK